MKFDFIEIGTSDFDSLAQQSAPWHRGISVEPVRYYLDRLPSPPNLLKICAAIGLARGETQVFYVPDSVIQSHGLPGWMRGCNSVGDYHWQHLQHDIKHLVQRDIVPIMPLQEIFTENLVTELELLKLDTEGQDSMILLNFWPWARNNVLPRQIQFESNQLTATTVVDQVIDIYAEKYRVCHRDSENTLLELR